jgi:putative restriction endonuclease
LAPGRYLAAWPVFIVGDDKKALTFTVAVDDPVALNKALEGDGLSSIEEGVEPIRRKYITSVVKQRLHQGVFRERVIAAYKSQCALCRLRHSELLDAAHIVPDSDPEGEPHVSNGLALCKIHHAAFDRDFLAITPDYEVRIRDDLMLESDGPMLKHGLQGMNGTKILLPSRVSDRPNREFLERRFNMFIGHMAT